MKPLLTTLALSLLVFSGTSVVLAQQSNSKENDSFYQYYGQNGPAKNADGTIVSGNGFVPCSGAGCSPCDFVVMFNTILKWFLLMVFLLFAILAVKAGINMVVSGSPAALTAAKKSFTNAFIGLFIILAAWLLIDTLLRMLLPGGQIQYYGPWSKVQCVNQTEPGITAGYFEGDAEYTNYHVPEYADPQSGSCSAISDPSSVCNPTNLSKYFGSRANEASSICNKESGGRAVNSKTDICCGTNGCQSGDPSFSGGIFQINVLANAKYIPGCNPGSFYTRNGTKTAQGDCVQRNSAGICTGWSCQITNVAMYNTCMQATKDPNLNLQVASKLYNQSGFTPWNWSKRLCGIN